MIVLTIYSLTTALSLSKTLKMVIQFLGHKATISVSTKSLQLCPNLCDPMNCSPSASSVHGTLQARILECIFMLSSGDLPNSGMELAFLRSPTLADRFFITSPPGKPNIVIKNAMSDDHFSMTGSTVGTNRQDYCIMELSSSSSRQLSRMIAL